jgi:VanZ family protein
VVLWAAIILLASNDSLSSTSTAGWFERTFGFPLGFWPHAIVRKCGHIFEYTVLAVLAYRASGRVGIAVLIAFVVAAADETKQAFTLARTGSPWDVLLDTCAAFLATLAWRRFTQRRDL